MNLGQRLIENMQNGFKKTVLPELIVRKGNTLL